MGMFNDWYAANPNKEKLATNVEFTLKELDKVLDLITSSYVKKIGDTMTGPLNTPALVASGSVTGQTLSVSSSRSKKKSIKPFKESALAIIKKISIVSFFYKGDKSGERQVGFIAEDTDELLSGKDHDKMNLNTTLGLLLKAVQELNDRLERLESRK